LGFPQEASHTSFGKTTGKYFGLVIGFTVLLGVFSVGNISGGAFNPAMAVGISCGAVALAEYLDLPCRGFFGGAAAAGAFRAVNPTDN
jgi:aquaporin Z